jgi:hypothetical protein
MPILYSEVLSMAIHVVHKTGVTKIRELLENTCPYPANLFAEMDDGITPHAHHRIVVVRPHTHRVLSAYYDKIVDPCESDEGWRLNYSSPSNKFNRYYGYDTFLDFAKSLGLNAHDKNIQPYMAHPISRVALIRDFGIDQKILMQFVATQSIHKDLRLVLNHYLELDPSYAEDWWKKRTTNSLNYSHAGHLPPSSEYGADSWSQVSYEELYRCFQDYQVLPAPDLMYDEETLDIIKSQMGYVCDQLYLRELNPHAVDFFRDECHLFKI